jgi:glycosyltransferase involved in cell wall biosynthesis
MKIAFITPGGFDRSGRERVIPAFLWLVEQLARHSEVHVYTLRQYPEPCIYSLLGATVHNIGVPQKRPRNLRSFFTLLSHLRAEHRHSPFDVIHGVWLSSGGFGAALAGRLLHVPSLATLAGGEMAALPEIGYGGQLRMRSRYKIALTLRLANAITAASEYARRPLLPYRLDAHLIPFGVNCERFTPAEPPPGPPWNLLHVASLNRVKDQATLLRAFRTIQACEPRTRLQIIGEDTLNGEIQRLAHELGVADAVTFEGFQPNDVVADAMRRAHLLLVSSRHESGPLVMLEAAACCVPTVGTAVGHIEDLAPDAAVAVPPGDHAALAWAVTSLLRDETSRRAIGLRARSFARTHDATWTAERFTQLYGELAQAVASRQRHTAHVAT